MAKPPGALRPKRSPKAGRPPRPRAVAPRVKRRRRRAKAAMKKGPVLLQVERLPRFVGPARGPRVKKR